MTFIDQNPPGLAKRLHGIASTANGELARAFLRRVDLGFAFLPRSRRWPSTVEDRKNGGPRRRRRAAFG
ncbi:MAG TPA: hypothetical protein PKD25_12460, partial [Rubrivivax sp.]|nr:hypothetical protein [Rubrivivax sp.]